MAPHSWYLQKPVRLLYVGKTCSASLKIILRLASCCTLSSLFDALTWRKAKQTRPSKSAEWLCKWTKPYLIFVLRLQSRTNYLHCEMYKISNICNLLVGYQARIPELNVYFSIINIKSCQVCKCLPIFSNCCKIWITLDWTRPNGMDWTVSRLESIWVLNNSRKQNLAAFQSLSL